MAAYGASLCIAAVNTTVLAILINAGARSVPNDCHTVVQRLIVGRVVLAGCPN